MNSGENWWNMFHGQVSAKVGAFYRVAFPRNFREQLGNKLILTYGFEQSILATSEDKWDQIFKKELEDKSVLLSGVRDIKRVFLGGVSSIEFDTQGRFIIPDYLRDYARIKISGEVVFIWQRKYVEIWDKNSWNTKRKGILESMTAIADKLSREGTDE